MDKPLTRWYCDLCGEPIETPDDGLVVYEYLHYLFDVNPFSFRIVHKSECDADEEWPSYAQSRGLQRFLGKRGALYLDKFFESVDNSPMPLDRRRPRWIKECVELHQRCQVPYYEEARTRFNDPNFIKDFPAGTPRTIAELKAIIEKYPATAKQRSVVAATLSASLIQPVDHIAGLGCHLS